MPRDLTELLLNDQNAFLAEVTSEIAQRVGVAAAQQDALAQLGKVQPEIVKPENQHLLRAEIQRVAAEHPEFGGNPYQLLQQVHENSLSLLAAQKAAEDLTEKQRQAEVWAAENEKAQEHDFAQRRAMAENEEENLRLAGKIIVPGSSVSHAMKTYDPTTRRMLSAPDEEQQAQSDAADAYAAEQEAERRAKFHPHVSQLTPEQRDRSAFPENSKP